MNILYSIQATGNGHISRAMELMPYLLQHGRVDIFLSGANSTLEFEYPVKYRSKGLSLFYTCKGRLDYSKTFLALSPLRIRREIRDLPVERYDLILNDFECITSLACAFKKIPSVNFGHQASFYSSKTPRPQQISRTGEWILKNYARASVYAGLHFRQYDDFIFPPVIRKEIMQAEPVDKGYFTVYLPSYCEKTLMQRFHPLKNYRFYIFSWETKQARQDQNITFLPVDRKLFSQALTNCSGIISGAGFETPAEALKLKKKLMVIPIRGQYEQLCNATALQQIGVTITNKLDDRFQDTFENWIGSETPEINYDHNTQDIIEKVITFSCSQLQVAQISDLRKEAPALHSFLS